MLPYAKPNDQYLAQKVLGASPEGLVALLLEGGQRFLAQAAQAIQRKDVAERARLVGRVLAILDELMTRLNHEEGGEVVTNLVRLYDWWGFETVQASTANDASRIERVIRQMGDLRETWEELDGRHKTAAPAGNPVSVGLVG